MTDTARVLTRQQLMAAGADEAFRLAALWRLLAETSGKSLALCREDFFAPLRTELGALQLMWLSETRGAVYVAAYPWGSRLSLKVENGVDDVVMHGALHRPTRPGAVAGMLDRQAKDKMIRDDADGLDVCAGRVVGVTADAARFLWPALFMEPSGRAAAPELPAVLKGRRPGDVWGSDQEDALLDYVERFKAAEPRMKMYALHDELCATFQCTASNIKGHLAAARRRKYAKSSSPTKTRQAA